MHYNKMMAEVLGKSGGYCKGKGGSMHIADVEHGNLGATGIVGGNIPVAVGAALAQKLQGTDRVVRLLLRRRRVQRQATSTNR